MDWSIEVLTAPAYEPVSRAEAKRWLRIEADDTDHDLVVDLLRKAMRADAENRTGRAFVKRQLRLNLSDWPWDGCYGIKITLPHAPLVSVDSFKYIDTDGVLTTLAADQYDVHDEYEPAFIIPAWEVSWPTIRRLPNAVQVTYWAGYAPGSPDDEVGQQENVPANVKLWVQTKMATLDVLREQVIAGAQAFELPRDYTDGLLDDLVLASRLF